MRYRRVSLLITEGEAQVDPLIYCQGRDAEDILTAATLSEEDKANFEKVADVFPNRFVAKRADKMGRQTSRQSFTNASKKLAKLLRHF